MMIMTIKFKIKVIIVALDNIFKLLYLCSLISLDITIGSDNVAIVSNKA